ncbi:hypothetical protein LTR56_010456 [Elasticomyces elasticus]|nr:hypothetical protein LTR56_010456 [Elasticomyces elasticus]KAK3648452.1 hypothetical protein LTR22_013344 [Elasticomyces elasticus]KAK4905697.1 hypothetical protein LTR49_025040 [Elasticomyces elasticus]
MAILRTLRPLSSICASCARQQLSRRYLTTSSPLHFEDIREPTSRLPRVATPSFWSSLIPKPFRRKPVEDADADADATVPPTPAPAAAKKSRFWQNPYTAFLLLGLLVGSNAIQLIALRNDTLAFSRKTEAKLALLREVVAKVKRGEIDDAEVKRALGTGNKEEEAEWEAVVKEIEETDVLLEAEKRKEAKRVKKAEDGVKRERESASPVAEEGNVGNGKVKFLM